MQVFLILNIVLAMATAAGRWKVFQKAGVPGWGAIIPFYNWYLVTKLARRPWWWVLLMLIPFVAIVPYIGIARGFAKRDAGLWGVGMAIPITGAFCWPALGFGDDEWQKESV